MSDSANVPQTGIIKRLEALIALAIAKANGASSSVTTTTSVFVYRPGGPAAPGVYVTSAALLAAVNGPDRASNKIVSVDSSVSGSAHIGGGPWPDNITWQSGANSVLAVLVTDPGTTFGGKTYRFRNIAFEPGNGAAPVMTIPLGHQAEIVLEGSVDMIPAGAGDIFADVAGVMIVDATTSVLGDGTHALFKIESTGSLEIILSNVSEIFANTVEHGTAPGGALTLLFDESSSAFVSPVQDNANLGVTFNLAGQYWNVLPIGGSIDDWPNIMGIIAPAAAASGKTVVLGAGVFSCQTALPMPSNLTIMGTAATTITLNLPNGGIRDVAFQLIAVQDFPQEQSLAANNVPGSDQVSAAGAPAGGWIVGSFVELQINGARLAGSTYKILAVVPVGPDFTLTFDRPVLYQALAATALLVPCVPPQNVTILGGSMTMNGSATQFIEVLGAIDCKVSDILMDGSTMPVGAAGAALDGAFNVNCEFRRLQVTCTGGGIGNAIWATGEGSVVSDCVVVDPNGIGVIFGDNAFATLEKVRVYGSLGAGIILTSDGAGGGLPTTTGNAVRDCYVASCVAGFFVTQGFSNVSLEGCVAEFCGDGCVLDSTGPIAPPNNIKITSCSFVNNTNSGLKVEAGVKGTIVCGLDVTGNAAGIDAADDVTVSGMVCKSQPTNGNAIFAHGAAVCTVSGYDFTSTQLADLVLATNTASVFLKNGQMLFTVVNATGVHTHNTSRVSVDGLALNIAVGVIAFANVDASVLRLTNITTTGAGAGGSLGTNTGAGCTVRIGPNVNMGAIGTGNQFTGAGFFSRSAAAGAGAPVLLAGLAAQAVAWPDLTYADDVMVELVTPGGTPGPVQVTKVPGTGFSLTGTNAAEASHVNYVVL